MRRSLQRRWWLGRVLKIGVLAIGAIEEPRTCGLHVGIHSWSMKKREREKERKKGYIDQAASKGKREGRERN